MTRRTISTCNLDELEVKFLSAEQAKHNRLITVKEQRAFRDLHHAIQQAHENRFRHNIITLIVIAVIGFLLLAALFPDRYEVIQNSVTLLVTATSSFFIARNINSKQPPQK